ncbi:TonB-dependent receptor [Paucihalobacter ruber]|uniref:TonB-dependent receptor n=1 Tax=Paucihalobacter ruber TaxID=2567861 RepID=A0A506PPY4_9FLAO|nr:TonB-dependent receptor [Paucihalobacter ruber]TPV35771.1 TonB-dependent receptor [Paucihalobacter ruber]
MNKFFILLFLTVVSYSNAQVKVQGVVKDSIGSPLELANVIAINIETNSLDAYAITNDKGRYQLSLNKNARYKLQVSYIGMKTSEETIETKESDINKDFILIADNALDAVELTYEMPVTISGDTIVYNADSFKSGTERKLEDVLKKLPGVEVNADGQIEVDGVRVQKLMIDGKDFFDGDTKLGVQNIPSNAVDKIQVLKNYAEVGQLSGVQNNQDNIAINIKLKEGKKNFWFGDVTVGGGASTENELYLAQPKLFYYSPKYSINFIGDMNNIGELALSNRDIRNFSGGFRNPSRQSGTNINLGNNNLNFAALQNNRAQDLQTKLGAASFNYSPNNKLDLSGFAIFAGSRIRLQQNRDLIYTDQSLGIPDEETRSRTRQSSDQGILKLSAIYKPNVNNQLDYDVLGRMSKEVQTEQLFSSVLGNTDQIEDVTPFSINQNLNYYYTLDEKNIFAFEVQHLLQDEDPFYNAVLEDKDSYENTATALGFDNLQNNFNIAQDRRVKSNQLDAKLDYWNVLNNKSNINFTFGTILSRQDFDSNMFQFLDDNSVFTPTPIFNDGLNVNDTQYNFSDLYVGVHYTLKSGIFTLTPGFSAHAYGNRNVQFGEEFEDNFFRVLPDFLARIQLKKSETIIFNYRMQNQFTDVTNLARGLVLNSFNSIFSGNEALENALSHSVNLTYRSFNLFNYTNVIGTLTYNKSIDQIRNLTNFESVIRTSSPFNSAFADETFSAFGRFQRTFGKIRATANGRFNYAKFNQFIQNVRSVNQSYGQTYTAEVNSNFREAPNFTVRYTYGIDQNDQGSSFTKFYRNAPSVEFDALIWKTFTFRTDYAYNNLKDDNSTLNTFEIWNASLNYRKDKDSKFEYEIRATNLLNTQSQVNSSANNISVSVTEYFIQPRFITFRLRYNL